jgi:NAD(P)-dependent dehydrogenase (short-subunit alcohol dehydrogenase family)
VVGAGSGIGRESALALAAHGAQVVCADRDLDAATATAALGAGLAAYGLDVLDGDAVSRAGADLGDVDVLVFTTATNVRKRLLDYSSEEFDRVVSLNLRASFDLVRVFGAGMAERGRGSIIGFSSIRAVAVAPPRRPASSSCSARPRPSSARAGCESTRSPPGSSTHR